MHYLLCTFTSIWFAVCNCDARGTEDEICNKETGDCLCLVGYSGNRCDGSAPGFWGYPLIQSCGCHEKGSASSICDASGDCACLAGFAGRACDQCSPGYYNFPECMPCNCDQAGSIGISCDHDGKCRCKPNYDGIHCDMCREGFYNFPLCEGRSNSQACAHEQTHILKYIPPQKRRHRGCTGSRPPLISILC